MSQPKRKPRGPSSAFAFICEDGSGRLKRSDQVVIRSHSMLGKNKRSDSRRSLREKARCLREDAAAQKVDAEDVPDRSVEVARRTQTSAGAHVSDPLKLQATPSDMTLISFVEELNPSSRELMYKSELVCEEGEGFPRVAALYTL